MDKGKPNRLSVRATLALLGLLVLAGVLVAVMSGPYPVSASQLFDAFTHRLFEGFRSPATPVDTVLFSIRLPRIAAALLVGAALAAAGCVFQGLFRNPLVSPDILGVSTGAGLGAAAGIVLSLPVFAIQGLAFAGGLVTVTLVYLVARGVRGHEPTLVLVLTGVVLGALAGACLSLLKVLADPYDQLPAITFWLLGSLASVRTSDVLAVAPAIAIGLLPLVLLRSRMNLMALGDEEAGALGVDPRRLRLLFIAAATLMSASVVAICGVIGWVGLVMPHVARLTVGPNFDRLLPTAMLMGAAYLLLVDTLARTLTATETPLGILTALVGAPVFLWLLASGRRSW